MIADAFILPTEKPFVLYEIKRALLSFDKVILPSPHDRELIPCHTFLPCVAFTAPQFRADIEAVDFPKVRPLGKINRYDELFEVTLEECKPAIIQGNIAVRTTPTIPGNYCPNVHHGGRFLGIVNSLSNARNDFSLPAGAPAPFFVYRSYRAMAGDPDVVSAVMGAIDFAGFELGQVEDDLVPASADDPGGFGAIIFGAAPAMRMRQVDPFYYPPLLPVAEVRLLNQKGSLKGRIALSRIATLAKYLATCQENGWQPLTSDPSLSQAIKVLQHKGLTALERPPSPDGDQEMVSRLMRLHQLVLGEFLDPQAIIELSVEQILRLRTSAWGRYGEARTKLFEVLANLARDCDSPIDFDRAITEEMRNYQAAGNDFKNEAKRHGINIMSVCGTVLAASTPGVLNRIATGGIPLLLSLLLSGLATIAELKQFLGLWKTRDKVASMPGCALLKPYSFVTRKQTD
jgi:hypothetical protein